MATVKKTIGRLPVYKGDWVAGTYSMLNQVTYLGSTFQSKIDNNTSQPATLVNNALQVNANWSVVSNGTAAYLAGSRLSDVEEKNAQLEQDVNLLNRRPQGLKFKSGDNSVFAKTMKALVLGTDDFTVCVVARMEGSGYNSINTMFGFSKSDASKSLLKIQAWSTNGANGIHNILFEGITSNSIVVNKTDNTTNLHHIVITRSGTLVTVTVNGRLVKSVTQDRILDFSNFIYDIANTSYFWGGAVFNYAMTQAESNKLLWNGGRYDEVRLGSEYRLFADYNNLVYNNTWATDNTVKIEKITNKIVVTVLSSNGVSWPWTVNYLTKRVKVVMKIRVLNNCVCKIDVNKGDKVDITGDANKEYIIYGALGSNIQINTTSHTSGSDGNKLKYEILDCRTMSVLLEYRPENIRADKYLNSGVMGTDGDLVYSPTPPEIIYDKPYADKVMLDENKAPDWHPIAIGQEVITPTNIFKAKLPDVGAEWQVSDWKQTNN